MEFRRQNNGLLMPGKKLVPPSTCDTLMVSNFIGFGGAAASAAQNDTLLQILTDLSLTANLELCLDAGDGNSYTSGAKWLDVSGNGIDFHFGAAAGADTDDPTFNGTADGRSSAEYMSGDGGDFFRYDSTNETFMKNWHKNNSDFTAMIVYRQDNPAVGNSSLIGNEGGSNNNAGMRWKGVGSGGLVQWDAADDNGSPSAFSYTSTADAADDGTTFSFVSITIEEAAGGSASFINIDGTEETFDGTFTSPTANDPTYTTEIMATGNGAAIAPNNFAVACVAVWSSGLTQANVEDIRTNLMTRFA